MNLGASASAPACCPWQVSPARVPALLETVSTRQGSFRGNLPMNRPTPTPSEEGSTIAGARREFPSWEGSGVGSRPRGAILESCDLLHRRHEFPLGHLYRTRRCRLAGRLATDHGHRSGGVWPGRMASRSTWR